MLPRSASSGRARSPVDPPPPQPLPPELWLIRNRRTGEFVRSHQESCMVHREILLTAASREAAEAAVRFLRHYASVDPEPVPIRPGG